MTQSASSKPPAVFIMGPTASGKSNLAVQLAQELNAEIISVDSALVYRGMNIGTAKPTLNEQGGIIHHLLDILDPIEAFSTGQFRTLALNLMNDITARGKLPMLVGGTMLYFNALNHGLAILPAADTALRLQLNADFDHLGKTAMHQRLAIIDPVSAARIHPNDPQRVQRALEVYILTGRSLTNFIQQTEVVEFPFQRIKFVIAPEDRKILHDTIAQRFRDMLAQGLIEEVRTLFQRGDLHENLPSMRAVGYRQIWHYLKGDDDYIGMTEKAIAATRQLAKRQFTWLRKEIDAHHLITAQATLMTTALQIVKTELKQQNYASF
ncbi:MAG: tRNA (adenosine(37)-N6)-dimethylallyltransferase MiaA [Methylococcaceae bacterium]|nr:tRNA (adenosine(37)-N6)-dimethylallyltransferase MiaA [Methylococcaceae bacterium]